MRKFLIIINIIFFIFAWTGISLYTFFSFFYLNLPYSWGIFGIFLSILSLFGLLLSYQLYRFWCQGSLKRTIFVLMMAIIIIFFWGFGPFHTYFSNITNTLQLRWLSFAYIWEVFIIGLIVALIVIKIISPADYLIQDKDRKAIFRFNKKNRKTQKTADIHFRIAQMPMKAGLIFFSIVVFGYSIGAAQIRIFSHLTLEEHIKIYLTGITAGAFAFFVLFFLLKRILQPALEISGKIPQKKDFLQKRSSLFVKIYTIAGLLVIIAVWFFGSMAYTRGQIILEDRLKLYVNQNLAILKLQTEQTGYLINKNNLNQIISIKEIKDKFGQRGEIFLFSRSSEKDSFESDNNINSSLNSLILASGILQKEEGLIIDRDIHVKIFGALSLNRYQKLVTVLYVNDFRKGLNRIIVDGLIIFLVICLAVAIIGTFFSRSITLPIKELEATSKHIGRENFSYRAKVYTNDELEDLGYALNKTSKKLQMYKKRAQEQLKPLYVKIKKLEKQIYELEKTRDSLEEKLRDYM